MLKITAVAIQNINGKLLWEIVGYSRTSPTLLQPPATSTP